MAALSPDAAADRVAALRGRRPAPTEMIAGLGAAGLVVACFLSADHVDDGPVICPFRRMTGLPCPGCGLTRSWVYLTHGRLGDAVAANAFGPLLVAGVLALLGAVVVARVRRRPAPDLDRIVDQVWMKALLAGWLVFAAVRLVVTLLR